jgi:PPOX class probable F420-dependent enzyme
VSSIDYSSDLGQRIRKELAEELIVWMTTTSADGTPQPNPVWFVTDGDDVIVYSHNTAARNRNIVRNPSVSLNFNSDPEADRMSVIIGNASIDDAFPSTIENETFQAKYGTRIPGIGMTVEEHSDTYGVVIRITPTKIRGW